MPKVVRLSNGAKWKSGAVAGNFQKDEFGYLGLFEELLPEHQAVVKEGSKKNKNFEKKDGTVDRKDAAGSRHLQGINTMKLKRKKKKARIDIVAVEGKDASVKEDKNEVNKSKKIRKKRKGEKIVQFEETKKLKRVPKETVERFPVVAKASFASPSMQESDEVEKNTNDIEKDDDFRNVNSENWREFYLPDPILKAIMDMRFESPTEIQRLVLPMALRDHCDVLGAAETGSGKTLAYGIPLTARLLEMPEDAYRNKTGPKALVLAPTRELVMQVMKHLTGLLKHTRFKAFPVVGGLAQVRQARILKKEMPEVIVATPGRLWAMMQYVSEDEPVCPYLADWTGLLCLVIDETDRMVEKGHFEEMEDILKRVRKSAIGKLQTLVFSATLTYVNHARSRDEKTSKEFTPQQKIMKLIRLTGMRPECKIVDITRSFGTAETLVETRMNCSNLLEKDTTIVYLLERYKGRTLVFANSVDASRRLYGILKLLKLQPLMIHAKMEQKVRLKNLEKFIADSRSVLLATDVAARGLDIQGIDNVIHYQVPKTAEIYIHRSGRTARALQRGLSVLIVDSKESHLYQKLCINLNREKDLPVFPIDCPELMKRLITRVRLASTLDTLAYRSKKIRLSESWFGKVVEEAELEMDDLRKAERENANAEMDSIRAKEFELQAELRAELAEPLPSLDRVNIPKTRYINPEVVAKYAKVASKSTNSLDALEENLIEADMLKRRARKLITTHQLNIRRFKRKKKKN